SLPGGRGSCRAAPSRTARQEPRPPGDYWRLDPLMAIIMGTEPGRRDKAEPMNPCINQVTTLSNPFEADLEAYARSGWEAVELWLTKLETFLKGRSLAEVKAMLADRGLRAAGASSQGGLLLSTGAEREAHWDDFRRRLDLLAELGVPALVVAVDYVREPSADDYVRAVASLAEAADLAGKAGIRLALEFQKGSRFCASLDTAVALVMQADRPNLGVCLD